MENTTRDRQMIDTSAEVQADESRPNETRTATASRSLANPRRVRRA
jgi:hypothetical protein